jgi:hypothetical protein
MFSLMYVEINRIQLFYGGWIGHFNDEGCSNLQNVFCIVTLRVKVLPECSLPLLRSSYPFDFTFNISSC